MEIAQRLRGDPGDSYVRVSELVDAGIVRLVGGTVQAPSTDEPPGGAVPSSRLINTTGSLSGGGDLSADLTLQLLNDNAAPGNSYYYGTDGSGVKGFFAVPAGVTIPLTTKGDLFTFDSANARLAVGTNGQVLSSDSTALTGLKWVAVAPLTTKGDVYTFSTVNARLAVGSNGQVLTADSTAATGLKWATGTTSPLTTKGDVWGFGSADARVPIGTNGWVLTADSGQTLGLKWAALPAGLASPLTTKGDVWGFSSVDARLAVGSNGQMLTADSTQTLGVKWSTPFTSSLTTKGDLQTYSTVAARLGVGSDGQVLTADSAQTTGIKWASPATGGNFVSLGSTTVAGAAATTLASVTLDLNTDIEYQVRVKIANATASNANISLFFNADTTPANYDTQVLTANNATLSGARANNAILISLAASLNATVTLRITRSQDGFVVTCSDQVRSASSGILLTLASHSWRTLATNVTSLTISSSVATSLAIGSSIKVWKLT